ncbi:uncharacterized protein LOC115453795 [Manduca sexta]|uniref:uncharacterized protein LOC115453795 n=1 Tax=Manduca sexta TaxID=7130 RepID=UPI00188F2FB2|nr:uncharacterized protein LOC115453795 [Manduca sexta]XP_030038381.2 uncharacterized protein LOC115453795 [Manduca sexta]XP_030038382.2 uncharacterized protein LOC115453795 [Manduca sexta]XP_030038383.2 uncharacterized protein LOC115453795 [Manduca sexta]XP_037300511.1 uncharacterized protein LOC115453795 [Manduca sexta]
MNQLKIEQELQELAYDIDFINNSDNAIPPRLSRKLKRIPRLSMLEMMFDEPSSSEDNNNYMSTRNSTASSRQRCSRHAATNTTVTRTGPAQNVNNGRTPTLALSEQQEETRASDAAAEDTVMQDIIPHTGLAEPESNDGRVRTRTQESQKPTVLPSTSSDDDASNVMGQIIKRIFFSLTQSNNSKFSKPPPPNPSPTEDPDVIIIEPSSETATPNNTRMNVQENRVPQQGNSNVNNKHTTRCPRALQMKRTYNLRSLNKSHINLAKTGTDKPQLDASVRNEIRKALMKEKQSDNNMLYSKKTRKIVKKSTNSVHIYNIILKKCTHPKVSLASRAKKPTPAKERNFGECPVCLDKLDITTLRSTQCGHVFCVSCISNVYNAGDAKCPTCRGLLKPYGYHKLYL